METTPSLKQFVAWVTGLTDKYRYNPFFRTAVNITVVQVILAAAMIAIFSWAIKYAQDRTVTTISEHISSVIATGTSTAADLDRTIDQVREHAYELVFFVILALNALFGYFMAKFALRPARQSLARQKQFIGNIAHELRTPLAIIKTNTEVALFDEKLDPAARQTFKDTLTELDRMSEIINNLLTFESLARPRRLEFESVDIRLVTETVLRRLLPLANERGVKLAVDSGGSAMVDGNAAAIDQILTNVIKNAINFTPEQQDGSVRVMIETDAENRTVVTIADTGVGIAHKDLPHVFEPFYRGDASRARGAGAGTSGLGLAIVNELVRMHRASITVRSALGRGTVVKIIFPPASPTTGDRILRGNEAGMHEVSLDFS